MHMLLDTLRTVFTRLSVITRSITAGCARSDILALTTLVAPLDPLAGELVQPRDV